jgi:2-polyprenyl-3-methyl-5-hydroxy-6-metoxy-1,4-benzoquinol methylase
MTIQVYQGGELELFQHAHNWKRYYASRLRSFISGEVLEVGAGIGGTTPFLCSGREHSWTCLEPDPALLEVLRLAYPTAAVNGVPLRFYAGTIGDLQRTERFQTIIYIDVLEHIDGDQQELAAAVERLTPGGHIVVLSPAHEWLYSEFDRAIGHVRRYNLRDVHRLTPHGTGLVHAEYLDSVGVVLSLANRLLAKQRQPRPEQIAFWDTYLLPVSRVVDKLMSGVMGRSVAAVWRRN